MVFPEAANHSKKTSIKQKSEFGGEKKCFSEYKTFVSAIGNQQRSVHQQRKLCVGDGERKGVTGKQGRLRSPFHLLYSEMKWPSQVCGGVGEKENGRGVLKNLISLSPTGPPIPTNPLKKG